jgi:opacity protein-like surface antigen
MKKIILASALAAVAITAHSAGSLTAGSNSVAANTSGGTGNCELLSANVTITLSTSNIGYYDCNSTSASIGLGIGNTSGKNKVYSLGSAGGAITETTLSAVPTTTNAQTQAQTKSASS